MKLFLDISKANACPATAHSSMALQVTGAFCTSTAGLTANSKVAHFLNPILQAAAYSM